MLPGQRFRDARDDLREGGDNFCESRFIDTMPSLSVTGALIGFWYSKPRPNAVTFPISAVDAGVAKLMSVSPPLL